MPGVFRHPTQRLVELQPVSTPAPRAIDAPPMHAKRQRPPVNYSSAFAAFASPPTDMCLTPVIDAIHETGMQWFKLGPSHALSATGESLPPTTNRSKLLPTKRSGIKQLTQRSLLSLSMVLGSSCLFPLERRSLKNKWVFRIKRDAQGNITRYKARLCACGYNQVAGLDYKDVYSPVVRTESFRLFLAIFAGREMECIQMDVVTAFLNGSVEEDIFMKQPPGYVDQACPDHVCKIVKNLYGLKQAPRVWHNTIDPFLKSLGFTALAADPCVYYKWSGTELSIKSLYVDDLAVASDSNTGIKTIRYSLMEKFKMADDGELEYILGMKIRRDRDKRAVYISSQNKIVEILKDFNMASCSPASTPMDQVTVSADDCPLPNSKEWLEMQEVPYRESVGRLSHLMRTVRPDIAFAVSVVNRYLKGSQLTELEIAPIDYSTKVTTTSKSLGERGRY
eukprot:Partr_v1_DN18828_c0_g1_i1_m15213 putative retrotransposon Tto1 - Nicotiana tabacumSimilarity to retrotransposon Tto1 -Nicotiana tabacumSimilarity to reverse transcriptase pol - Volvox carteri